MVECNDCSLRQGCRAPVPGYGNPNTDILFIAEAPGKEEDQYGRPLVGKAGKEFDNYLYQIGIDREDVYCTNVLKCRPPNNRTPTEAEVAACAYHLTEEMANLHPKIIVLMGGTAISLYFPNEKVEHVHGIPRKQGTDIILPIYHPAAGLHNTRTMKYIQEDFQVLKRLVETGEVAVVEDECPNPFYDFYPGYWTTYPTLWALDTEVDPDGTPAFVSMSNSLGTGLVFPSNSFGPKAFAGCTLIMHNALYDIAVLDHMGIDRNYKVHDTMVMAYLLSLPQSLKTLAYRLCGMEMQEYLEVVKPYQPIVLTKKGLPSKAKRSIRAISWSSVPQDVAVYYSARDADATWRVYHELLPMLKGE